MRRILKDTLTGTFADIKDSFVKGIGKISGGLTGALNIKGLFKDISNSTNIMSEDISASSKSINENLNSTKKKIVEVKMTFTDASAAVKEAMVGMGLSIFEESLSIADRFKVIKEATSTMRERVASDLAAVINRIKALKQSTAESIGSMVGQLALGKTSFGDFVTFAIAKIALLIAQITILKALGTGIGGGFVSGIVGSIFGGIGGFAAGGQPPVGQPSIVGEQGPELFVPSTKGTVIPNDKMGMGGMSVNININQNLSVADLKASERNKLMGALADDVKKKLPNALRFAQNNNNILQPARAV